MSDGVATTSVGEPVSIDVVVHEIRSVTLARDPLNPFREESA
jgi:hypothetical protein